MGVSTEISIGLAHELVNALIRSGATKEHLVDIAENKWGITDELVNQFFRNFTRPIPVNLIESLDLSSRSYNCLKRIDVNSIEDLCRLSEQDLLRVPGIGSSVVAELKEKLAERGHSLRNS